MSVKCQISKRTVIGFLIINFTSEFNKIFGPNNRPNQKLYKEFKNTNLPRQKQQSLILLSQMTNCYNDSDTDEMSKLSSGKKLTQLF